MKRRATTPRRPSRRSALPLSVDTNWPELRDTNLPGGPARPACQAFFRRNLPSPEAEGGCGERMPPPASPGDPGIVGWPLLDWLPPLARGLTHPCPVTAGWLTTAPTQRAVVGPRGCLASVWPWTG